jgi:hypothetical protein
MVIALAGNVKRRRAPWDRFAVGGLILDRRPMVIERIGRQPAAARSGDLMVATSFSHVEHLAS